MKRKANTAEIPRCTAYLNTIEIRGLALERKKGKTAITTRRRQKLQEEERRGWGEVDSDGCRRHYEAVAVVGEMGPDS